MDDNNEARAIRSGVLVCADQAVVKVAGDRCVGGPSPYGTSDSLGVGQEFLVGAELSMWLALRRIHEGGVALLEEFYYHHGRAVPHYLNSPLTDLVGAGHLTLGEAGPDAVGMRKVTLTDQGRELYAVLCGKRGVGPGSPVSVCTEWAAQECEEKEGYQGRNAAARC